METLRKLPLNSWRIFGLPFHPAYYLAWPMAVIYFFFPHFLIKALPIWLCSIASIMHNANQYSFYIAIGLLFGSFGDILLEMDNFYDIDLFIPGLISFLIGHLFYIRSFINIPPQRVAINFGGPLCVCYYTIVMGFLLGKVNPFFIAPLLIYGAVITSMVFFGINRFVMVDTWCIETRVSSLIGCVAFIASDTILSFNTFYSSIRYSGFLIMITYYFGQFLIAASCQYPLEVPVSSDEEFDEALLNSK